MAERIVLLSIPQLRRRDVTPGSLASLDALASRGQIEEVSLAFPAVTAPAFATLVTGVGPYRHGIVGNAYFDRARGEVARPPIAEAEYLAPPLWQQLKTKRPDARSLVWFGPYAQATSSDWKGGFDAAGQIFLDPPELADELNARFGPCPGFASWQTMSPPRLEHATWILQTAAHLVATLKPDFSVVRLPHLSHVARRFGPDSREVARAILEFDRVLGPVLESLQRDALVIAVTESIATPVYEPVDINLRLRGLGLVALREIAAGGLDIDVKRSAAFALVDEQICHIYVNDVDRLSEIAAALIGTHSDGIATVAAGSQKARLGLDHPRSGEMVLIANAERWFRGDWWRPPEKPPRASSGLSGLDSTSLRAPADPAYVKGSLGTPERTSDAQGVLLASRPLDRQELNAVKAHEVAARILRALEAG